mgnify:CR=1 FL=1
MLVVIAVLVAMDAYVYFAMRKSIGKSKFKNLLNLLYILAVSLGYTGFYFLYSYFTNKPLHPEVLPTFSIGFFFSFMVFKLLLIALFLAEDLVRLLVLTALYVKSFFVRGDKATRVPGRRNFIRQAGLLVASIPFASMIYGVTKGKYNFQVNRVQLGFDNLPASFDGFRMVHISDIHSGSFSGKGGVLEGINLINQQDADLICFTGDLVNNDSKEIEPFIEDFKQLRSKYGIYSTLGNHDYGDYKSWESEEAKQRNMELLFNYQQEMGFKLLNNDHVQIQKDGESILLCGVENWGNPPFPQRGDLDLALKGADHGAFKILMSHDPTHWDKKVVDHKSHFDLTLAGHTHGMQFGVEIPGFKWSPIKYIYPQWAGLYEKASQLLYVNRGFGFLGFPGRVGIWPEITVFEFRRNRT